MDRCVVGPEKALCRIFELMIEGYEIDSVLAQGKLYFIFATFLLGDCFK